MGGPGDEDESYAGSPNASPSRRTRILSSKSSPRRKGHHDAELTSGLLDADGLGGGAGVIDDVLEAANDVFPSPYVARSPVKVASRGVSRATAPSADSALTPSADIATFGPLFRSVNGDPADFGPDHVEADALVERPTVSGPDHPHDDEDGYGDDVGALGGASRVQTPGKDAARGQGARRKRRGRGGEGAEKEVTARGLWLRWVWSMLAAQVTVLVPVSVFLILFQVFALRQPVPGLGGVIGGLIAAMFGLSLFMLGLEIGIMPLGEAMGRALPRKVRMSTMLFLVFVLGCGCTFAEPAVSALQIAGQLIDPVESPYLWLLLVDPGYNMALIIAIALGVGLAAVVGTLRTVRAWSLKLVIAISTTVTLGLTVAMQFSPAAELVGMAWDSGAVTTGCVTVPLVLALGVGILSATRRDGSEAGGRDPSPLDGFGIVTLASLYPVCFVLALGLVVGQTVTVSDILEREPPSNRTRVALGLNATGALVLDEELEEQSAWAYTPWLELYLTIRAISPLVLFLVVVFKCVVREPFPRVSIGPKGCCYTDQPPWYGVFVSFLGLLLFNIGLSYGLSALGSLVGSALPGLFMKIEGNEDSPLMERQGGLTVVALFCWFLGLCATLAEPALNQLGITTEALTRGKFRRVLVIGSVAAGVSIGVMLGTLKLILDLREALFYMLYTGYSIALGCTALSTNEFVCVAWDSGGVTTGAVTVPLVLAIGLGIGRAVGARDAFGLLAMASVMPVLSVLLTGLVLNRRGKPTIASEGKAADRPYEMVTESGSRSPSLSTVSLSDSPRASVTDSPMPHGVSEA